MSVGILCDRVWKGYCVTNKKRGTKLHEEKSIQGSIALHIANLCRILIFRNVLWISDAEHGISMLDKYQNVHQKETIRDILSKVPEPCNKLLRLVYIHDRTPKEIVDEMGYSDERVVRKRKSVCLKNLRELLIEQRKNQDDE